MKQRRPHDTTQRRLFAHPELIKLLITGFIPQEITGALDLERIEQLKDTFVSQGLAVRESDMLWKIPRASGESAPLYICLLLEFQSSIDPTMPIRILQYVAFIYEGFTRDPSFTLKPGSLPPVLPVVLYNGTTRWRAPVQMRELIASPQESGLSPYLPTLRFFLIDEGSFSDEQLDQIDGLLAQLIKLENIADAQRIPDQVAAIIAQLKAQLPAALREDVATFVSALLEVHEILIAPHNLLPTKENTMLTDAIDRLKKQAIKEGLEEGLEKGLEEGLEKGLERGLEAGRSQGRAAGLIESLEKLMTLKFGASETRAARLAALSPEQLDQALALILSAQTERDLFEALEGR